MGQLRSAFACFPACTGDRVRVQQFGDAGVIGFRAPGSGDWRKTEKRTESHYELSFENGSGASLQWRIPFEGYLLELEMKGVDGLDIRSGESFRPREAAGFGTWLEQSRYAVINDGDVRQTGFDDTDVSAMDTDGWAGYRNRYWTLVASPPQAAAVNLHTAEDNLDAHLTVPSPRQNPR